MNAPRPASYLRSQRKQSGLSQQELAQLVGYPGEGCVSRHERFCNAPTLLIALGYEAVFHVPAAKLFPALFEPISRDVETRIKEMESHLHDSTAKGRKAVLIAQKLEWMWARRNPEQSEPSDEPGSV